MTQPSVTARYVADDVTATLTSLESGEHLLEWTDGINQWEESYAQVAVALARFAVLVESAAVDRFLLHDETAFPSRAQAFIDAQLEPEPERSRFRLGQRVRVRTATVDYFARFLREERNPDRTLNGVALVRIVEHPEPGYVGQELHVGISVLELA